MPCVLARRDVENRSARDRHGRARRPEHEAVPGRNRNRPLEVQLNPPGLAGADLVSVEHDRPARDLDRAGVEEKLGAMAQPLRRRRDDPNARIHPSRRPQRAGPGEHVAPRQLGLLYPAEVRRDAVAGAYPLHLPVVPLQAADPHTTPARHDLHLVTDRERPVDQGAGHDGAEAAHGEHAVDRQARPARILAKRRAREQRIERRGQLRQALAGDGRYRDDLRAGQ